MSQHLHETDDKPRGFLVVISTVALSLAAAGIPSALYPTYKHEYGLSALAQTGLFATYAVVLLPALIIGGGLLRRVSGQLLLVLGLGLVGLADLLFAHDGGIVELFCGRGVQGIGIGFINAAAGVLALTTREDGKSAPAALGTALATAVGLGVGVLGAGAWLRSGPQPAMWPYLVHLGLMIVLVGTIGRVRPRRDPAPEEEPSENADDKMEFDSRRFSQVCAAVFLAWGYGGLLLAVMANLATAVGGSSARALGPVCLATMFFAVTVGEVMSARFRMESRGVLIGLMFLVLGGAVLGIAAAGELLVGLVAAAVLLGLGLGVVFVCAIAVANRIIPADRRASLLPRFYACVFGGNAVPAVAVGFLADHSSLTQAVSLMSAILAFTSAGIFMWMRPTTESMASE